MNTFSHKIAVIYRPFYNNIVTSSPYQGGGHEPDPENMLGEVRIDIGENVLHPEDFLQLLERYPEKTRLLAHWADRYHLPQFTHWESI